MNLPVLVEVTFEQQVWLIVLGAALALIAPASTFLIKFISAKFRKLEIDLFVMRIESTFVSIKLRFTNKSTEPKHVSNIRVFYLDSDGTELCPFQAQNDVYESETIRISHDADECETCFSYMIPPKTVEEHVLGFYTPEDRPKETEWAIWFGGKKRYSFLLKSTRWQAITTRKKNNKDRIWN